MRQRDDEAIYKWIREKQRLRTSQALFFDVGMQTTSGLGFESNQDVSVGLPD